MTVSIRGMGWFKAGAITFVLLGATHLLAVYNAYFGTPRDEAFAEINRSLREYSIPLGPFQPTAWGTVQILSESYSLLTFGLGALNLLAAGALAANGRLRAAAVANALLAAGLLAISLAHQFPPPALFGALATVFFAIAVVRIPGGADQARA